MKLSLVLVATMVLGSMAFAAEDGAALYKGKCAGCHGAEGQGKMGPALKGTKLSESDLENFLAKGEAGKKAPHGKGVAGLTADQAKAIAGYVKSLK